MIASLHSLRFVFAVMIFLHHYVVAGEGLFYAGGTCGVSFFMILSGFVMSAGYGSKVVSADFKFKDFYLKRLIRLYPLHLFCLLGFVVLRVSALSASGYIKLLPNLALLQSWIPMKGIYFSGNAVSWCLSDMLFFYAMFPLLSRFLNGCSGKQVATMALGILIAYVAIMFCLPEAYVHSMLYISPVFRLLDFIIGMLVYRLLCHISEKGYGANLVQQLSFTRKSAIELFAIAILVGCIVAVPYMEMRYYSAFLWWLIMPFLILLFTTFNKSGG